VMAERGGDVDGLGGVREELPVQVGLAFGPG
jgi:hypothetical protein